MGSADAAACLPNLHWLRHPGQLMLWHRQLLGGQGVMSFVVAFVLFSTNGRSRLEGTCPLLACFMAAKSRQAVGVGELGGITLHLRQTEVRCQGGCSSRVEKGQYKAACSKGKTLLQCSDPHCPLTSSLSPHLVTVSA